MFLEKLEITNLKGEDLTIHFTERVTVLTGPNGVGKSALITDALSLLARGVIPAPDIGFASRSRNAEVLDLARDPSLPVTVRGFFRLDEAHGGGRVTASRTWKLQRGSVKQTVDLSRGWSAIGWSIPTGNRDKQVFLEGLLAAVPETWSPTSLTAATPETMRAKLLAMVPRDTVDIIKLIPPDFPKWARPDLGGDVPGDRGDEDILDWIPSAIRTAEDKKSEARAAIRVLDEQIEQLEAAWEGPKDPTSIKARLADLREEQRRAELGGKQNELDQKSARMAQLRAVLGSDPAARITALNVGAALHEAVAMQVSQDRQERHAEFNNCQQVIDQADPETIAQWPEGEEQLKDSLEGARKDLAEANAKLEAVKEAYSVASARCSALDGTSPLTSCPECGADLAMLLSTAREAAHAERERVKADGEAARKAVTDLSDRFDVLDAACDAFKAKTRQSVAEAYLDAPNPLDTAGDEGRAMRAEVREIENLVRELADVELDVEILTDEVDEHAQAVQARSIEIIEKEIAALESEIEQIGEHNGRAVTLKDSKDERDTSTAELERYEEIVTTLKEIRSEALRQCVGHLEHRIGEACGLDVRIRFQNDAGKDDCRITFSGVPINALSTGQRLMATFAVVSVVAGEAPAAWKAVPIDRIESIDKDKRRAFIEAVHASAEELGIDQVFLVGCPDTVPSVAGVQNLYLDDDGVITDRSAVSIPSVPAETKVEVRA